jgi:hypothetical protein
MKINFEAYAQNKNRKVKKIYIVANFLGGLFMCQTQKPDKYDTSAFATFSTLTVPVLSTVFEIPRWCKH